MITARTSSTRGLRIVVGLVLALLVVVALAAQLVLPGVLEERLRTAIDSTEGWAGRIDRVDVCSPCLSYTIHGIELRREGRRGEPDFEAAKVEVGLGPGSLLRMHPGGRIVVREPTLRIAVGRESEGEPSAFDVPWARIGRTLLPVRLQRFRVHEGRLSLAYGDLDPPVHWHFRHLEVAGRSLAGDGGQAEIRVRGRTPGEGHVDLGVVLRGDGSDAFTLGGRLDGVALRGIAAYLHHAIGLDVEGGELSASVSAEGTPSGWSGVLDGRLTHVDLFAADDVASHPLQALQDAMAGALVWAAEDGGDALRTRLTFEAEVGEVQFGAWGVLATLVERALRAPFRVPARLLGGGEGAAQGERGGS